MPPSLRAWNLAWHLRVWRLVFVSATPPPLENTGERADDGALRAPSLLFQSHQCSSFLL